MIDPESVEVGSQNPRISPDYDAPTEIVRMREQAAALGITLYPWQEIALQAMTAKGPDGWLFRETATVVARQQGKSKIIAPLVRFDLTAGRKILHTAQNRIIPRRAFMEVASSFPKSEVKVRLANGQEEVRHLPSGGSYVIIAPQRGVRGYDADRLIIDEIREYETFDFVTAAEPTLTASATPQINYFSNAGNEKSVVLNDLKERAGKDSRLGYMEWSADPEYHHGDVRGWLQANPSVGYHPFITVDRLRGFYESNMASGNIAAWETERLCRWVVSMLPRLVNPQSWLKTYRPTPSPERPLMGISVAPDGSRASAALSWALSDGSIGLQVIADVTGSEDGKPIDVDVFAADLKPLALELGVQAVAFDPWTDQHLARHFDDSRPITGQEFANASERFVRVVEIGQLRHNKADAVTVDLPYVSRKQTVGTAFMAERADPRRPITAALAAIRAVWLAAEPNQGPPNVW